MITIFAHNEEGTPINVGGTAMECDHLPRVGEIVTLDEVGWIPEDEWGNFIVLDVYHSIESGKLASFVDVVASDEDDRLDILRSKGWISESNE